MKSRSSYTSNIIRVGAGFGMLALLTVLVLVATSNTNTKRPEVVQNVATLPSPVSTVYATIVQPSVTVEVTTQPVASVQPDQEVGQGNYGSWSYRAVRRNGQILAGVRYDNNSVASLNSYAAANVTLANQLALQSGDVDVYITFRTYVSPAQFRAWATAKGLHVKESYIRVIEESGIDGGLNIAAIETDPLPQDRIDTILQKVTGVRSVPGVYFTIATISANQLLQISTDPQVFLADVTPNIVRNELLAAHIPGAEQASVGIGGTTEVHQPSPFWKMEHDFGLENFQVIPSPTIAVPTVLIPTISVPTIAVPMP